MKRARILLADDHKLVAEGLRSLLEPEFEVVGIAEDGRALLASAEKLQPDVIVLDISMPLLNGIDAARQLQKTNPHSRLIFLTMHAEVTFVTEAFRVGAAGFLLKRSAGSELVTAIHAVLKGQSYLTPLVTKEMVGTLLERNPTSQLPSGKLTPRQREILQLVAEGHSIKEIAGILNVSTKTVEFHKYRMMEELGLHTTAELTQHAIKLGLLSP